MLSSKNRFIQAIICSCLLLVWLLCGSVSMPFAWAADQSGNYGSASMPPQAAPLPPLLSLGSAAANPEAVILCLHGLGLHKGCYAEFGKFMSGKNIAVYALDLRGFGDWYLQNKLDMDLNSSLADVRNSLAYLKMKYPQSPLFLLGESMGGAVALRACADNPELLSGLISSVPSGDRWSGLGSDLNVGLHVLAGGFNARFNVGEHVVKHAAKADQSLQNRWNSDPASRKDYSPNELIAFQNFMDKNNETAKRVKTTPVLIIQGQHDRLVKQGGSFNVWDNLLTPARTFVESKTAEHLIFEYGQFSKDDINYLLGWLDRVKNPAAAESLSQDTSLQQQQAPQVPSKDEILASAPSLSAQSSSQAASAVSSAGVQHVLASQGKALISYWIELMRDGKRFACNNKTAFKSGDEIRLHVQASENGYAYIIMKQGSSGAHAVLFPDARTGRNNLLKAGQFIALPSATWLKFDDKAGKERISLVFSRDALDPDSSKYLNMKPTVLVSADKSGAKDLCPTRMQIAWDDANPLIIPASAGTESQSGAAVRVMQKDQSSVTVAVDIELEHIQ